MNIYVTNLSKSTSEEQLRTAFTAYGEVQSVKLIMDQFTGRSRGFAFIDMNDSSEAKEAIKELNNSTLDGQFIIVDEARPKSRVNNESNKGGYSKFNDKRY